LDFCAQSGVQIFFVVGVMIIGVLGLFGAIALISAKVNALGSSID
jgi:hypothetical protein